MSTSDQGEKIKLIKEILKSISEGVNLDELKRKYGEVLKEISPFEIALIEQQLIKEGLRPEDILKVCDLHLELFRQYLESRELEGVPEGHPLRLLMLENQEIVRLTEALNLYVSAVKYGDETESVFEKWEKVRSILNNLKRSVKLHYRKNQMLIFPYLERRGINAVPRVLWGKEDELLRELNEILYAQLGDADDVKNLADKVSQLINKILDLVFRENKILYPTVWVLFKPGEWRVVHELAKEFGYIVKYDKEWSTDAEPIYPYMVNEGISEEEFEKLPREIRSVAENLEPDTYSVRSLEDLDLGTGFLKPEEVKEILNSLPLELTYADSSDRVKFFTKSKLVRGFPRAETIIGRRIEYCHPPRLENYVKMNVDLLKKGKQLYREFWTRIGDRIIRVLIVGVRDRDGNYLGTLEIVEDFTDIVRNPNEVLSKVVVL